MPTKGSILDAGLKLLEAYRPGVSKRARTVLPVDPPPVRQVLAENVPPLTCIATRLAGLREPTDAPKETPPQLTPRELEGLWALLALTHAALTDVPHYGHKKALSAWNSWMESIRDGHVFDPQMTVDFNHRKFWLARVLGWNEENPLEGRTLREAVLRVTGPETCALFDELFQEITDQEVRDKDLSAVWDSRSDRLAQCAGILSRSTSEVTL